MEAQETNVASTPPTGRSALASVICLSVGVGLMGFSVLADRGGRGLHLSLGLAGLLGAYAAAPLLGLVGISSTLGQWRYVKTLAATGNRSARMSARAFLVAGPLFAGLALLPLLISTIDGVPLHLVLMPWWLFVHGVVALLGLAMTWIALRLYRCIPGANLLRGLAAFAVLFGLTSVAGVFSTTHLASYMRQRAYNRARQTTFAGDSTRLERTVIVPTLDSPSPPGKNVIWCSSFQLAWNEIRDNVIGAPLQVIGAQPLADRLNNVPHCASDLDPRSVYAAGGWIRDGIVDQIKKDMAARFPSQELPDFNDYEEIGGLLAYSYLTAHVPFKYPFRQVNGKFTFTDSQGNESNVKGFGLWQAFLSQYEDIRRQIEILYVLPEDSEHFEGTKEYALDLCRHSEPYQVVVAVVEPKGTLAETYEHVQQGIEQFRKQGPRYEHARWFQESDELRVPEMFYRIDHRFTELIGKMVANVGMPIVEAMQTVEFRLDRSGALLESQARVAIAATPREFLFDRPFLIYMKKRNAARPFFVMWVDNAELLDRK